VHLGAASYCIEDNRQAMQMRDAAAIIAEMLVEFGKALKSKAIQYRLLAALGRTHTQPAEIITMGFKFANHLYDIILDIMMWRFLQGGFILGKPMNGAVGTSASYVHLAGKEGATKIAELVMSRLGINPALITNQIVTRKSHAFVASGLASIAMTCYKFAQEFYHLGRPEIGEVLPRKLDIGKVGSSAMPHKAAFPNDIDGENVMGNARIVKNLAVTAWDDIPTIHERTLDNSAAERTWVPLAFLYTEEVLARCIKKLGSLVVVEPRIQENLEAFSWYTFTEPLMMELVKRGLGRQQAHHLLQVFVVDYRTSGETKSPVSILMGMPEISSRVTTEDIARIHEEHKGDLGMAPECVDKVVQAFDMIITV